MGGWWREKIRSRRMKRRETDWEWVVGTKSHKTDCKAEWMSTTIPGMSRMFFQAEVHVRSLVSPRAEALPDTSSLPRMNSITSATVRGSRNYSHCTCPCFPIHHVTAPSPEMFPRLLWPLKKRAAFTLLNSSTWRDTETSAAQQTIFHMSLLVKAVLK